MADMICIRCGSRAHSTRDHDEGKVAGAAGAAADPKKKKKTSQSPAPGAKAGAAGGAAAAAGAKGGPSETLKKLYVHHDKCWARPARNPGIPDVIEPPFRMQPFEDPCIASWSDRDECLCKECEKKRKKSAFQESQRQKRIAERGKFG